MSDFKVELIDDIFVRSHLDTLYDNLLAQNLSRIIEPFSKVQIDHIAHLIKLPKVKRHNLIDFFNLIILLKNAYLKDTVERKLSQMILDKKLSGKYKRKITHLIIFSKLKIHSNKKH